jgi:hypothetical protein
METRVPAVRSARPRRRPVGEILRERGSLTQEQLDTVLRDRPVGVRLGSHAIQCGFASPGEVAQALAIQGGYPYRPATSLTMASDRFQALPGTELRGLGAIPVEASRPDTFAVGAGSRELEAILGRLVQRPVALVVTEEDAIESLLALEHPHRSRTEGGLGSASRRRSRRVAAALELDAGPGQRPGVQGRVLDLSRRGVRLELPADPGHNGSASAFLEPGTDVWLRFLLPGMLSVEALRLGGTVRWLQGAEVRELGVDTRPVSLVDHCRLDRLLVRLRRLESACGRPSPAEVATLRRAVLASSGDPAPVSKPRANGPPARVVDRTLERTRLGVGPPGARGGPRG